MAAASGGLLALLWPPAQQSAGSSRSAAEDKDVLLEAKAAADTSACVGPGGLQSLPCPLDSWDPATDPCGDGYDDPARGWVGVLCAGPGPRARRVVAVYLWSTNVRGELLPIFARLGALVDLDVEQNQISGDVAALASAASLRALSLKGSLVTGDVGALAALSRLEGLWLVGSAVHGDITPLRSLPGLGGDWGTPDCSSADNCAAGDTFSSCAGFDCSAAGLPPVRNAASVAGIDACACCGSDAPRGHTETGECSAEQTGLASWPWW